MKARRTSKQEALTSQPISSTDRVPLVVTYNPALPNFHSILKKHHQILFTSSKTQAIFKETPLVAYRRGRNININSKNHRNSLIPDSGLVRRADIRCKCCKTYGKFTATATSSTTGERIKLRQRTTCKTSNVIYLLECSKCNEQYVGETGYPVHHRGNQHRSDIKDGHKNIPSVRHFKKCGVENLKLTAIKKVRSQNQEIRKARENCWILRLNPTINKLTT